VVRGAAGRRTDRQDRSDRAEKTDRSDKADKADRADKAESPSERTGSTQIIQLRSVGTAAAAQSGLPADPAPVPDDHHLGDRLGAFVDGELDHESRERVQAHLATCRECLAEAEDHRRLKDLLGGTAGPSPTDLFTSRLMSIAAGDLDDPSSGAPGAGSDSDAGRGQGRSSDGGSGNPWMAFRQGGFGSGGLGRSGFGGAGLLGSAPFGGGALGADRPLPGVDPRAERSGTGGARPLAASLERALPNRGRRFVFVAAGAFSVAAVALSGALSSLGPAGNTAVEEPYGNVSPVADSRAGGGAGAGELGGPAPVETAVVQAGLPVGLPAASAESASAESASAESAAALPSTLDDRR
jgi:hypothetical protein